MTTRRVPRSILAGVLALACGGFAALPAAHAAGVVWQQGRYVYETSGSSLAEALRLFAEGQNVQLHVSSDVSGTVRGRFSMPPQQFLEVICASYGLVWYDDGSSIYVLPVTDQQALAIRPNYMKPAALVAALDRSGATDPRFPLQIDGHAGTVGVMGPPAYVERVRVAAQRLELDARDHTRTTVKVLRLKTAIAADQVRTIDGRNVVVQGAATRLAARFAHGRASTGLVSGVQTQAYEFDQPLPVIEADAATNSILVRDKPERIDGDAMLVDDFDTQPKLVSVQTWVVDVDRDALAELGDVLPLHAAASEPAATTDASMATPAAAPAATSGAPLTAPVATVSTDASAAPSVTPDFGVASGGGQDLFARLHALIDAKRAHTEVSRTALTVDRSPAVIDRHEAILARREGDEPDPAMNLWLAIQPTLDPETAYQQVKLRVDLGPVTPATAGQRPAERIVAADLAPGECLVIAAPPDDGTDPRAPQRLVLLIPRIPA